VELMNPPVRGEGAGRTLKRGGDRRVAFSLFFPERDKRSSNMTREVQ
jgi:hypothetical protein